MKKEDVIMTWDMDGAFYVDYDCGAYGDPTAESVRNFIEKYDTDFLRKHLWFDTCKGERGIADFDRDELIDLAVEMAFYNYYDALAAA